MLSCVGIITNKYYFRTGEPQPDNAEGVKEGPIDVENNIGKIIN